MADKIELLQDIQKTIDAIDKSADAYIASFEEENPRKKALLEQIHKKRRANLKNIAEKNAKRY